MFETRIAWWRRQPKAASPRRRGAAAPVLQEDERPLGCGWFDSSHELMRGLNVFEPSAPEGIEPALWIALSAPAADPSPAARTADRCG